MKKRFAEQQIAAAICHTPNYRTPLTESIYLSILKLEDSRSSFINIIRVCAGKKA